MGPVSTFVVQLLSRVQFFVEESEGQAGQASLSFSISLSLLKLMSIESVMPSNHLIFRHPLAYLPLIFSHRLAWCLTHNWSVILDAYVNE